MDKGLGTALGTVNPAFALTNKLTGSSDITDAAAGTAQYFVPGYGQARTAVDAGTWATNRLFDAVGAGDNSSEQLSTRMKMIADHQNKMNQISSAKNNELAAQTAQAGPSAQ